jgi:hypothetical protein
MTAEVCRQWRESLGVHALGQLDEPERAALEAHLEGCAECRAEASSLAGMARMLPLADPARLDSAPEPPAGLASRVAAGIAAERRAARRRRRLRVSLALGAAAATAAVLAVLVLPSGGGEPSQRVAFTSVPPGVRISAALEPRPFGTQIRMQVGGIRSGTLCRVFLRRDDGARVAAGTFRYRYGGDSEAVLSSALDLSRADAIGVRAGSRTFLEPIEPSQATAATAEEHEYNKEKT